jgi:RNA polymerase sigma-70 factor (ECF subfamily)
METRSMAQTAGLPAGTLVGAGMDGAPGVDAWLAANWSLLLRAARGVLSGEGEAVEAEDAAQDAAVKIWRHWGDGSYDPARGSRMTWAYTITVRQAIDRRRRITCRKRAEAGAALAGATQPSPSDGHDPERRAAEREQLSHAWSRLSPKERRAAVLIASGHTLAATAAQLAQPVGTVKAHVRRMRLRLAKEMVA